MGSSSKRKSSKKKSSKTSSQTRRMKRSRNSKSKRLRRHHDSSDDSMSSDSISSCSYDSQLSESVNDSMSFSSEDSYRSRKKVTKLQRKTKRTGKRSQRRSSSTESIEDLSHSRKQKRSRKNADSKSRNHSRKKKPKRDISTSSASSDSYTSSTCKGGSSDCSEEIELQRLRITSVENKKDKRVSRKERIGTKKKTHRSPSYSSYSRSRDQNYCVSQSEETFMEETKSRRLRSVITIAERFHEKEGNNLDKDTHKEEIIYDRDDYPSSKSNNSSQGGSQRKLTSHSAVASDDNRQGNNIKEEKTFASNQRLIGPSEAGKDVDDNITFDSSLKGVETNNSEKETNAGAPSTVAGLGGDDIEALLRQKALENLRKFQTGLQRSVKTATGNHLKKDDGDVNQSSTARAEIGNRGLPKHDNSGVIGHVQMLDRSSRHMFKAEMSCVTKAVRDVSDGGHTGKESGSVEKSTNHPPEGFVLSGNPLKEDHKQAAVATSDTANSSFWEKSSGPNSTLKQANITQASPHKNLTANNGNEGKNSSERTQSLSHRIIDNQSPAVDSALSSGPVKLASSSQSTSGEQSLNVQQEEGKDASEFEQKTMAVMRGGEMVQVSYKVYIPKRAPAFSRRQLKR